jgi:hypothetical protein
MSDDDVIDVRGVVMAAMSSRCSGAGGGGWAEAVGGLAVSIFGNNLLLQPLFILRGLLFNCMMSAFVTVLVNMDTQDSRCISKIENKQNCI